MSRVVRTRGFVRFAYLGAGLLMCLGTIESFVQPGPVSPFLYAVAAALIIGGAVFVSSWLIEGVVARRPKKDYIWSTPTPA